MKTNRTERLKTYLVGRKKYHVAETLGVSARAMSYIVRIDLDELIARIDALPVEKPRRKAA